LSASLFAFSEAEAWTVAGRLGTPCFAYRLDLARERYDALRAVLPERAILAYAIKANPGAKLVSAFAAKGAYFDCASIGELELARDVLVPGTRVLLAGPGKSRSELRAALAMGARIQADGIEDLERLDAMLEAAGGPESGLASPLSISLRVQPGSGISEASPIIGGSAPSAFGVDEEDLTAFLKEASRFPGVRIAGLQIFAASNERRAERLLENHRAAFAICERFQRETGSPVDLVDLGGGLGIAYAEGESELDIAAFGAGLGDLIDANPWFSGRVVVEPGRWLAGPCGVYLARVVRTKTSRGERFAILEGGLNHLMRPLLTGQSFPTLALRESGGTPSAARVATTLAGPLCTSIDRLGAALLPPLEAGDLIMFGQAGAYGFTEAMTAFLGHPAAAEHWLEGPPARAGESVDRTSIPVVYMDREPGPALPKGKA
jgi:diaminopimelate decarboxylase